MKHLLFLHPFPGATISPVRVSTCLRSDNAPTARTNASRPEKRDRQPVEGRTVASAGNTESVRTLLHMPAMPDEKARNKRTGQPGRDNTGARPTNFSHCFKLTVMKQLLAFLFSAISVCSSAQTLPYGKFLSMTDREFQEQKFKYNKKMNQWILNRVHVVGTIATALMVAEGRYADLRPHEDDYTITVQKGEGGGVAYVSVDFYDDETYHTLYAFAAEHGTDIVESNSDQLTKCRFNYGKYKVELEMNTFEITSSTSAQTNALVKSFDRSYNAYTYTITTDVEPQSHFRTKQADKQQKRDEKGRKKRNVSDMM